MLTRLRTRRAGGDCKGCDVKIFGYRKKQDALGFEYFLHAGFFMPAFLEKYPFGVDIFRGFRENFLLFADGSVHLNCSECRSLSLVS